VDAGERQNMCSRNAAFRQGRNPLHQLIRQDTSPYDAGKGSAPELGKNARSECGNARVGPMTTPTRASEACFLLRTLNPVERLARDGVLSEKEAQLSRMFLHVAQGVQ
jgi:hypothetical protein